MKFIFHWVFNEPTLNIEKWKHKKHCGYFCMILSKVKWNWQRIDKGFKNNHHILIFDARSNLLPFSIECKTTTMRYKCEQKNLTDSRDFSWGILSIKPNEKKNSALFWKTFVTKFLVCFCQHCMSKRSHIPQNHTNSKGKVMYNVRAVWVSQCRKILWFQIDLYYCKIFSYLSHNTNDDMEKNDSIAKVEMKIENSHICMTFMIGVDICHFRTFHASSHRHKCLPSWWWYYCMGIRCCIFVYSFSICWSAEWPTTKWNQYYSYDSAQNAMKCEHFVATLF